MRRVAMRGHCERDDARPPYRDGDGAGQLTLSRVVGQAAISSNVSVLSTEHGAVGITTESG
jgi:hypothetical protein